MSEPRKIELISNGFSTPFDSSKKKEKPPAPRTQRFCLTLVESTDEYCPEFSFADLCKNVGNSGDNGVTDVDPSAPHLAGDDGSEYESMLLLAQKYEAKYAPKPKKRKREDRVKDLVDLGDGYDDTDSFVDNSEAYDEYIPCSISTKYGGFYINSGLLDLVPANDESFDEVPFKKKHKKSRPLLDLDDSQQNQPTLHSNNDVGVKRKRIKDGGSALGEKRRKYKFGDGMIKKSDKSRTVAAILNDVSSPVQGTSMLLLDPRSPYVAHGRTASFPAAQSFTNDDEPIDCSLHPASSSYGHSAAASSSTVNESKTVESFANSTLSNVDSTIEAVVYKARQKEKNKDVSSVSEDAPMPRECLTNEFLDMITMLSKLAKLSEDQKIQYFTPDVNRLVLKIDVSIRSLDESVRASVLAYIGGFFACGCKGLRKQIKKLNPTDRDDRLKRCISELQESIDRVMPAMMDKYREGLFATEKLKQDRMMDMKERDGKQPEEDSDEEEDNRDSNGGGSGAEKQKRITNPRRKFEWTQEVRACLCRCVDIKMKRYEMYKNEHKTLEEYLRSFLETEIKPLWQHGWIHTRILFRESRSAHERWTGCGSVLKPRKINVFPGKTFAQSSAGSGAERDPVSDTSYVQTGDVSNSANPGQSHSSINVDDQKSYNKSAEFSYSDAYSAARCESTTLTSSQHQVVHPTIGSSSDTPISLLSPPRSLEMSKFEASKSPPSKLNVLGNVDATNYGVSNADRNGKDAGDFKLPVVASSSPKIQVTQSASLDVSAAGYLFKAQGSHSATSEIPIGYSSKVKDYQSNTSDIPITNSSKVKDYQSATSDGYSSKVKGSHSSTSDGYSSKVLGSQSSVPDAHRKDTHKSSSRNKERSNKPTTNPPMFNLTPENLASLALYSQFFGPLEGINSAEYLKQFNWEDVLKSFTSQALLANAVQPRFDQNLGLGVATTSHSRSSSKEERRSRHGHGRSRSGSSSINNSSSTSSERRGGSFSTPKLSESKISNSIAGVSNESCASSAALKSPERMRYESNTDSNLLQGASNDRHRSFTASKSPESIKFDPVNVDSNLLPGASSERYAGFALPKSPEKLRFDSGVSTSKLSSGLSFGVTGLSPGITTDRYPSFSASKSPEKIRFESCTESNRSNSSSNNVIGSSESQPSSLSLSSVTVSATASGVPTQSQASNVDRYAGWRNLYPEKVRKSLSKKDSSQSNANSVNKSDLNATPVTHDTESSVKVSLNSFSSSVVSLTNSSAAATAEENVANSFCRTTGGQDIASAATSAVAKHVSSVNNTLARQQVINTRALGTSHFGNLESLSIGQSHAANTSASQASGILGVNNIQTYLSEATTTTTTTAKQSHSVNLPIPSSALNAIELQRSVNLTNSNNASAAKPSLLTVKAIGSQTVSQSFGGHTIGGQAISQSICGQTIGGQTISQSIGGQTNSQSIGGQTNSQSIGGQTMSQSFVGHMTRVSNTAQAQSHIVSLAVNASDAWGSKKSQHNVVLSPSPLSPTYRPPFNTGHQASSSGTSFPPAYQRSGTTVVSSSTVHHAQATSAPKSYAQSDQSVRPTTPVSAYSSSSSSLLRPHHPQTIEDQVQAELAATQAAQRRRIETLKTYAPPPPPPGNSHSIDLGSKSPRLISGGGADDPPRFLLSSSSPGTLHPPGAVWRTADLAVSITGGTSTNPLLTSLDRSAAWAKPSVSASYAGLVGGCERGSTTSSSQSKVPVSSTGEYQQVAGIQTKP